MQTTVTGEMVDPKVIERRFLAAIKHHLEGWRAKIFADFSSASYAAELSGLASDPVYSKFGLDCPEYVIVRLVGRMSISVGRRLGEIYDKLPRFLAAARFNVSQQFIAEKFDGLELDIGLRYSMLSEPDRKHVAAVLANVAPDAMQKDGVGIEIRYNFNPNDSSRLRKDCEMADLLMRAGLFPVYLIYSSISPRDEAIARLKRAGWHFIQGRDATQFTTDLFAIDFLALLDSPEVKKEIHSEVKSVMQSIFASPAFQEAFPKNN